MNPADWIWAQPERRVQSPQGGEGGVSFCSDGGCGSSRAWGDPGREAGMCIISKSSFLEQLSGGGAPSTAGKQAEREAVSASLPMETHSGDRA